MIRAGRSGSSHSWATLRRRDGPRQTRARRAARHRGGAGRGRRRPAPSPGRTSASRRRTGPRSQRRSRFPTRPRPTGGWPGRDLHARPRPEPRLGARRRAGDGDRRALRRARVRRARSRRVRRADRDRRPAGGRRREGGLRLAPRPAGRRGRPDRRLGRLVRRRRRLELARGGRAVGGARDLDLVDRPAHGARAAGAREDRGDRRVPRPRSTRSASTPRCSRSATPRTAATWRRCGRSRRRARRSPR